MRDIRGDLAERESYIAEQISERTEHFNRQVQQLRDKYKTEIEELKRLLRDLHLLSSLEERRTQPRSGQGKVPITKFLHAVLTEHGPQTKPQLYDRVQKSHAFPGQGRQSIHIALINLIRNGQIRKRADGTYVVTNPDALPLIENNDISISM